MSGLKRSGVLERIYYAGTSGAGGKRKSAPASEVLTTVCEHILQLLTRGGGNGVTDEWALKIKTSPRAAGAILLGFCLLVKDHYQELQHQIQWLFLQLVTGPSPARGSTMRESTAGKKPTRRKQQQQQPDDDDSISVISTMDNDDQEAIVHKLAAAARRKISIEEDSSDMGWLPDPDQTSLDRLVLSVTQQALLETSAQPCTGGTDSLIASLLARQTQEPDPGVEIVEEEDYDLVDLLRATPAAAPRRPEEELALGERSAIGPSVRKRTSVDEKVLRQKRFPKLIDRLASSSVLCDKGDITRKVPPQEQPVMTMALFPSRVLGSRLAAMAPPGLLALWKLAYLPDSIKRQVFAGAPTTVHLFDDEPHEWEARSTESRRTATFNDSTSSKVHTSSLLDESPPDFPSDEHDDDVPEFIGVEMDMGGSAVHQPPTEHETARMQAMNETINKFFATARANAMPEAVPFEALVPTASCSKRQAAITFATSLALAHQRHIDIRQSQPSGKIVIVPPTGGEVTWTPDTKRRRKE